MELELFIPILGIIAVFGAPTLVIIFFIKAYVRKRELMHDTINRSVESGQTIPEEMIRAFESKGTSFNKLTVGMTVLAFSIGLGVSLFFIASIKYATLALMPLFVGAALVYLAKTEDSVNADGA